MFSTAFRSVAPAAATDAGPSGAKRPGATARPRRSISTGGHLVITLAGTAVAFTVTAANVDERDVVPNLYDKIRGLLIGDKGFISGDVKREAAAHNIDPQTPLRQNMPDGRDPGAVARLIRTRRAVETAIGKLSERFAAQTTKAFQAS